MLEFEILARGLYQRQQVMLDYRPQLRNFGYGRTEFIVLWRLEIWREMVRENITTSDIT